MSLPLVSCVMPTYGRPDYVAESIAMFLAQDYPAKELIVLNDCPGQVIKCDFPGIRIINADTRWANLGKKRNCAVEMAQGQYIAVWDDDDVYLPWRLSYCVRRMMETETPFYCPAEFWAYWGEEALHDNQAVEGWICHPAVMFTKELWLAVGGYPQQTMGEDAVFLTKAIKHMGIDWPRDKIQRNDRFLIMRGKSKYVHTSIGGGQQEPDTRSGEIFVSPAPIYDNSLRNATESLIRSRDIMFRRQLACKERTLAWPGLPSSTDRYWLDQMQPTSREVGYGQIGLGGELGYEGKRVEICGLAFPHAISAHAPSRLCFTVDCRFTHFCSQVALNDDIASADSSADFFVYADGRLKGVAANVRAGQPPRLLTVDVRSCREIELIVAHHRWSNCHSVWCDPFFTTVADHAAEMLDCLKQAEISITNRIAPVDLCIATVASPGFETWIDDLLGSVCANAQCPNALLAIFAFDPTEELIRIAQKYRALVITCRSLKPLSCAAKSVLYSAARVIPAAKFICLDADILVLDDLRPVVSAIDSSPPGAIHVCREAAWARDLKDAVEHVYAGSVADVSAIMLDDAPVELRYDLVVNDGFFAGSLAALNAVDNSIRGFDGSLEWLNDPRACCPWRNQFIFNLALAQGHSGVELHSRFNTQLNVHSVAFEGADANVIARTHYGTNSAVVHFNGRGRGSHLERRGRYRTHSKALRRTYDNGNAYQAFLQSLRRWIGVHGRDSLAWSFYGTPDGASGRDCNGDEFPLLATLYYLIKANGSQRVIETGTARGITAACLAAAVSHHPAGVAVTIDIGEFPERDSLWATLPESIRKCILTRQGDSIEMLKAAVSQGESYHAAVLDTVHTSEHVLQEFEFARKLVCEGGLILIHDAIWEGGTVNDGLKVISRMGYGVARLWSAEHGDQEFAGMGLAVIENRVY